MRYGLPYKGSKNSIAEDIIRILPEGHRLVDLFGGGGAITHCAMMSNKWQKFLYNDFDKRVVDYFTRALTGEYEKRWISREEFEALKETDAIVAYCWSFGNNGRSYMYAKELEAWKKAVWMARVEGDTSLLAEMGIQSDGSRGDIKRHESEYRQKYIEWYLRTSDTLIFENALMSESLKRLQRLQSLQSLESLQSLQSLERLERLERLHISNISYEDYEYQEGDVVYCDIPYITSYKDTYVRGFNHQAFYAWVRTRPYQAFFSEYTAPDDFYRHKVADKQVILSQGNKTGTKEEFIFSNRPIEVDVQLTLFDFM